MFLASTIDPGSKDGMNAAQNSTVLQEVSHDLRALLPGHI